MISLYFLSLFFTGSTFLFPLVSEIRKGFGLFPPFREFMFDIFLVAEKAFPLFFQGKDCWFLSLTDLKLSLLGDVV